MTLDEFMSLTERPSMMVSWGPKKYKLSSVDKRTKTCYIKKIGSWKKAIPVNYESVQLIEHIKRDTKQ